MSAESTTGERAEEERASGLERWFRSPGRRVVLAVACILALSSLSTNLAVALSKEDGMTLAWSDAFLRNLATISVWGLLFEPLFFLARRIARWLRPWWLQMLVHVPLSLLAALGVSALQGDVVRLLGQAPPDGPDRGPPPERFMPPGERRPPPGPPPGGMERAGPPGPTPRRPPTGLFVYWALLGLAWGIDGFLRTRSDERSRMALALRANRLEKELASTQLSNLRRQLHPHFLFNALHSVGGLIRQGQGDLAVNTLSGLGSLLRAMLDQERRLLVPLCEELELIERYLEIEMQRLGARLHVTTHLDAGVARADVPALLLLPLVENAIQYAVASRPAGGRVEIDAYRASAELVLEVSDDGPGFPREVLASGRGRPEEREPIGLANTCSRLRALYGDAASLELSNTGGPLATGARVRIRLPLVPPEPGAPA